MKIREPESLPKALWLPFSAFRADHIAP